MGTGFGDDIGSKGIECLFLRLLVGGIFVKIGIPLLESTVKLLKT